MKVVENKPIGYLNALNYDVAFYSRRTIPIVSPRDPDLPEYLISWREMFDALPPVKRSRFDVVMTSNPTSLDGSDEMLLLRQRATTPEPPFKPPTDDYIQAGSLPDSMTAPRAGSPRWSSPTSATLPPMHRAG
jgi:hypothetical protein